MFHWLALPTSGIYNSACLDRLQLYMKNEKFRQYLLVRKGLRFVTIAGYMKNIDIMLRHIGREKPSHNQVIEYIAWMHDRKYSFSYIHNSIRSAELWMDFIGRPMKLGRMRKPKPIVKDTLTEAEVVNMMHHTRNAREKAILAVLAYSGIRPKEICNLRTRDVDLGNNVIRVIEGKGIKDGLSYVSGECTKIVIEYLMIFPRGPDDYLFTTLVRNNRYNENDLRKFVKVLARRTGIKKRVYPYIFRHSLATNMLYRGASIFIIKEQLRHAWIDTTFLYLRSITFGVKNDYQRFAPSYV